MEWILKCLMNKCSIPLAQSIISARVSCYTVLVEFHEHHHLELVYLVTAFVPSLTACLASSPGSRSRTAV